MGIFKRILGICETKLPEDPGCWQFSGNTLVIERSRMKELSNQGGAVRLEKGGLPERILILHGNDGRYYAFKNRCKHAGRRIDPVIGESLIRCCSVGKSTYDYEGNVVSGPASEPLPVLPVKTENGKLIISLE